MYIVSLKNDGVRIEIHNAKEKLASGKITKGINTIDSFQFTILPSNVGFEQIHDYTTLVSVWNTNKSRYEFFGRVLYSSNDMDSSGHIKKEVICENYFGFFCDSQQDYVEERNWTVGGLLQHIVNTHNSQVESYKQFTLGEVGVSDPNDNLYLGIQRENTWETLSKKLIEKLGGEFSFRVNGDVIYLDYIYHNGFISETEIAVSRNMKSLSCEKDPSEIVTRLIPLGCKLKTINEDGEEEETEYRLDITSVNNGKKYIDDDRAIALYGIRVGTVEFDNITVPSTLLARGEKWLEENNKIHVSYTVTALDLSLLGLDVDDFDVYNQHRVKNHLLGIDDYVRIIKKSIDICEEVKSTIELGDKFENLSTAMKKQSDSMNLITQNYVTNQKFTNENKKTSTKIEQTEEKINLVVGAESLVNENGEVQGGLLIEAINSEIEAKITAERIELEGKKLNIKVDATNIEGEITADQINANGMQVTDGTFSGDLSAKHILLQDKEITVDSDDGSSVKIVNITWHVSAYGNPGHVEAYATIEEPQTVDITGLKCGISYETPSMAGYDYSTETATIKAGETTSSVIDAYSLSARYYDTTRYNGTKYVSISESGTVVTLNSSIAPSDDSTFTLGTANRKWADVYSLSGTINTSDEREKNSMSDIPQKYTDMFFKLNPVIYKLNKGTSDRFHVGFSAQAVEQAMTECDITDKEFAGLIKHPCKDKDGNKDYIYGLRYGEFVALAVLQIQQLKKEIIELKARLGE